MKVCSSASGGALFIPDTLARKETKKSVKIQKAKTSNDNPGKKDKILK